MISSRLKEPVDMVLERLCGVLGCIGPIVVTGKVGPPETLFLVTS